MAEAFSNKLTRAAGIVTTSSSGSIGITTTIITGISTVGVAVSDLIDNTNFIAGTKVTGYEMLLVRLLLIKLQQILLLYQERQLSVS